MLCVLVDRVASCEGGDRKGEEVGASLEIARSVSRPTKHEKHQNRQGPETKQVYDYNFEEDFDFEHEFMIGDKDYNNGYGGFGENDTGICRGEKSTRNS